ncbi:MAG TPA: class I SAM-dependent methyltransferase [Blastocatellia bacterium]
MVESTEQPEYTERLLRPESTWKRFLPVQVPYRWNLRRLSTGLTLDLGCGIGRNLAHLDGNGVGVDHNTASIAVARARGLNAFTPEDFLRSKFNRPGTFDSLLAAHVLEHMTEAEAVSLVMRHANLVKTPGRLVVITPQELGFKSDPTHVRFMGFPEIQAVAVACGFSKVVREYSFPLPRTFGRLFMHNEFVGVYMRTC